MADDDDPDLDSVPESQLGELDAAYPVILDALRSWVLYFADHDSHGLGSFLDALAAGGYRITSIDSAESVNIVSCEGTIRTLPLRPPAPPLST